MVQQSASTGKSELYFRLKYCKKININLIKKNKVKNV